MDWLDYREKLEIGLDNFEKGNFLISQILNGLYDFFEKRREDYDFFYNTLNWEDVSMDEYKLFCNMTGVEYGNILSSNITNILDVLHKNKVSVKSFLTYYMALVNCLKDRADGLKKRELLIILENAFKTSRIKYAILKDEDSYFAFPKGVKEFDDNLISAPLEWLKDYPHTQKAWIRALKKYEDSNESSASETADSFRKALETFFQEFFKSEKSLENLISEYGNFMKVHQVPSEIRNNLTKIIELYTHYMNNYAKHHDLCTVNVLEYIMYQTGLIIRLLITTKEIE